MPHLLCVSDCSAYVIVVGVSGVRDGEITVCPMPRYPLPSAVTISAACVENSGPRANVSARARPHSEDKLENNHQLDHS